MYRFSFDLGSDSLGWSIFELEQKEGNLTPVALIDLGVRIFPTGRDGSNESNAIVRRQARQQRRQIDRRKKRRIELETRLTEAGLVPPASDKDGRRDFFRIDPYTARDRAARGRVDAYHLGRAIWHISKHRGFKSNRKTDRGKESDAGKIATASAKLLETLTDAHAPTYGAWLAERKEDGETVRVRSCGTKHNAAYDFYPLRAMLEREFDMIWTEQAKHHPGLTEETRDAIRDSVFFQRPLKPVEPGRCTFFPEDSRLPKWHPLAQEFLILQQLNTLRILDENGEYELNLDQRNELAEDLMSGQEETWSQLRKRLKIPSSARINLEAGTLKKLPCDEVAKRLVGTKKKPGILAKIWLDWPFEKRLQLLQIMDETASPETTIDRLVSECGITRDTASQLEEIVLPNGHLRLGARAVEAILQVFREEVVTYSEAITLASERGLFGDGVTIHHSDLRPEGDPGLPFLPRYNELPALQRMIGTGTNNPKDLPDTRFGRIQNPTVHSALGQFRRVINALIGRYGKPAQLVIETTRDMAKSKRELDETIKEIKKNTKRNDQWRKELETEGLFIPGQSDRDLLLRMRLWEELGKTPADRICPYSGRPISLHQLHSHEIEIDHILPYEDSMDDSPTNKTICFREFNRIKGKRTPADAWSGDEIKAIIARVESAPDMKRKLWRFLPGAMEKWEEQKSFEDRQLHATGYLARVTRAYAETLFPKDGTSNIWMPTGRMTAMLRHRWGINLPDHNRKNRNDHRHHALDAAVVGVIDRGMIQKLQSHARKIGEKQLGRVLPDPDAPFAGFRDQVLKRIGTLQVSHRPNHKTSGRLHEDTAYGLIRDIPENQEARKIGHVVTRKKVTDLTDKEMTQIRDRKLRDDLQMALQDVQQSKEALKEALRDWSRRTGHKRLRIIKPGKTVKAIHDAQGNPYKWMEPGEHAYIDVLEDASGKWVQHTTSLWDAQDAEPESWRKEYPDARFIMRLFKGDTIQLFELDKNNNPVSGSNEIKRVVSLQPSLSRVQLAGINEAGILQKRHEDEDDPFRWDAVVISKFRFRRARRVRVDELGRVRIVPHGTL